MLPHYFSQEISKFSTDRLCLSAVVTLDVCHFLRCVFTFFCIELRALNEYQLKKNPSNLFLLNRNTICASISFCVRQHLKIKWIFQSWQLEAVKCGDVICVVFFFLSSVFEPELCLKSFGFWINFQILYKFYSLI